jgi:hypothetical protein
MSKFSRLADEYADEVRLRIANDLDEGPKYAAPATAMLIEVVESALLDSGVDPVPYLNRVREAIDDRLTLGGW